MVARLRRWFRALVVVCAIAYPVGLLAVIGLLYYVGERWWVTGFALYLPRVLFAVPLPLIVAALAFLRLRRLLLAQVVSLLLWLFPLMGFHAGFSHSVSESTPKLRILQYNVNSCFGGGEGLAAEILAHDPQVASIQELPQWKRAELEPLLAKRYPHVQGVGEFLVASKFPILSAEEGPELEYKNTRTPARFVRFLVETPLGKVSIFSLHPVSPRSDFRHTRAGGLKHQILDGSLFERALDSDLQRTNRLRGQQIQTAVEASIAAGGPAILIGDINLPTLSETRHRLLGGLQDGFAKVGFGFGYTFPVKFPWLRLDSIFASDELRFLSFDVCRGRASDHHCVVAELARKEP